MITSSIISLIPSILFILMGLIYVMSKKRFDLFEPIWSFSAFYVLIFSVRPLYLIYTDAEVSTLSSFPLAIVYGSIGLLAFYIGYTTKLSYRIATKLVPFAKDWARRRIYIMTIVFLGFSIIGLAYLAKLGGMSIKEIFLSPLEAAYARKGIGTTFLGWLPLLIRLSFWLLYASYILQRKKVTKTHKAFLLVSFIIALTLAYGTGYRRPIFEVLLVPIILRHYLLEKKVRFRHLLIIFPFLFILPYLLQEFRIIGYKELISDVEINFFGFVQDLKPFDDFVFLIDGVPDNLNFQYGIQYFYRFAFIAFIPRIIWPDKPIISTEFLYTRAFYGRVPTTHTLTIPGELYLQFHVVGIIIGMFILGIILKTSYNYLILNNNNPGVVLLYSVIFLSSIFCLRANLGGLMISIFIYTLIVFLSIKIIRKKLRLSK